MASQSSIFIFIFVTGHFGLPITKTILNFGNLFPSLPPRPPSPLLPSPLLAQSYIFYTNLIGHVFVLHLHFNSLTWHDITLHNFTLTHLTSYTCMDVGGPFYTLTRNNIHEQHYLQCSIFRFWNFLARCQCIELQQWNKCTTLSWD